MPTVNIQCTYCDAWRHTCKGKAKGCNLFPTGKPKPSLDIQFPSGFNQQDKDVVSDFWNQCIDYLKSEDCPSEVGISKLQIVLRRGYYPVARIVEALELNGYVGPMDGKSRLRKVLCK